jgi:simple sugar transport system ATP-binding protein
MIFARELDGEPRILVVSEPSYGLDVRGRSLVFERLRALRDRDCAVVVVSADIDDVVEIADRVIVLYRGSVVLDTPNDGLSATKLGGYFTGGGSDG